MIGGGGGGAGTAAESAATCTAVVLLISSFRSFQEATLPAAKPSAHAEKRAPMLAILVVASHSEVLQEHFVRITPLRSSLDAHSSWQCRTSG